MLKVIPEMQYSLTDNDRDAMVLQLVLTLDLELTLGLWSDRILDCE